MNKKIYLYLSFLLFAVIFVLILLTFKIYGVSLDEPLQHRYGQEILRFYSSFFQDRTAMFDYDLYLYGGFFEGIAESAALILPFGVYETRHLINALFGLWGIIGAFMIGKTFAGNAGGFFSAFLIVIFPTYLGHMFNNSKDIPFAAAFLWGIYGIIISIYHMNDFKAKDALQTGIYCGIASGIKVGGLILFFYFFIAWLLYSIYQLFITRINYKMFFKNQIDLLKRIPLLIISAYIMMALFWPRFQAYPISAVLDSLHKFSHINGLGDPFYIPKYYLVKFPEWIFIFFFIGLVLLVQWLIKIFRNKEVSNHIKTIIAGFILFLSFSFTSIYPMLQRSSFYNEIRHMIFAMLPLIMICGISIAFLLGKINGMFWLRITFISFIIIGSGWYIYQIASLYPYEYSYFNIFAGKNLKQAMAHYEGGDYWRHANGDMVKAIKNYLIKTEGPDAENKQYTIGLVHSSDPLEVTTYYFSPWKFVITNRETARFILGETDTNLNTIYSIIRQDVIFGAVEDKSLKH